MAILFSNEILAAVDRELKDAKESVQIISAYAKLSSLQKLAENINPALVDKKLMIRFRLDDLVKKSTDFEILDFCMQENWKVYIRFDLHAKTYIVDNKRGILGSANVSERGLTGSTNVNFEMAALVDIEDADIEKIRNLYNGAICVDADLVGKLREQYLAVESFSSGRISQWGKEITEMFSPKVDSLFSYELPDRSSYEIGEYIPFLDVVYDGEIDNIREIFRWSNAYLWLKENLECNNGELYFGALTEKLHNSLVSDPKPYRKNVKQLSANLLSLIETWKMEEIKVDRPNYSQRVYLYR